MVGFGRVRSGGWETEDGERVGRRGKAPADRGGAEAGQIEEAVVRVQVLKTAGVGSGTTYLDRSVHIVERSVRTDLFHPCPMCDLRPATCISRRMAARRSDISAGGRDRRQGLSRDGREVAV